MEVMPPPVSDPDHYADTGPIDIGAGIVGRPIRIIVRVVAVIGIIIAAVIGGTPTIAVVTRTITVAPTPHPPKPA